jgi:hypothetical protein
MPTPGTEGGLPEQDAGRPPVRIAHPTGHDDVVQDALVLGPGQNMLPTRVLHPPLAPDTQAVLHVEGRVEASVDALHKPFLCQFQAARWHQKCFSMIRAISAKLNPLSLSLANEQV